MKIQIRAKSGLHAGATWSLDKSFVSLGSHPNSDVFLCDVDIPDVLLTLRRLGRRYDIEALSPEAKTLTNDRKPVEKSILCGQSFTLDFRHVQLEIQALNPTNSLGSSLADRYARLFYWILTGLRHIGAKAIIAFVFLISLFTTSYILFFGSVGKVNANPAILPAHKLTASSPVNISRLELDKQMMQNVLNELNLFIAAEGIQSIVVQSSANSVSLEAELSRKQLVAFENKLKNLARDYGDQISINAVAQLSTEQKVVDQFGVAQLILGEQPVAILRDGQRIYEGGIFKGLLIQRIDNEKIVLKGQANYEISL